MKAEVTNILLNSHSATAYKLVCLCIHMYKLFGIATLLNMDVYGWMDIDVATEIFFQLYMDVRNVTRIAGVASSII